jgi:hypothetical protein
MALLSSSIAPTASVSPNSATEEPKLSFAPVFEALTYACWVHVVPLRTNTYTAPEPTALLSAWLPLTPVAVLASLDAPTASVSPDSATEMLKLSPIPVFDALPYAT